MAVKAEGNNQRVHGNQVPEKEERLPPCDKPHDAEASRNEEADEACDDGVR